LAGSGRSGGRAVEALTGGAHAYGPPAPCTGSGRPARRSGCGRRPSAAAVVGVGRRGQRVRLGAPLAALPGLDLEALADPVLDAAEHLLDLEAELGQGERGAGAPVAAGAPAVRDHGKALVEEPLGLLGNEGGRQVE